MLNFLKSPIHQPFQLLHLVFIEEEVEEGLLLFKVLIKSSKKNAIVFT